MKVEPKFAGEVGVVIGTGPSLTKGVIDRLNQAREAGKIRLFGINNTFEDFPTLDAWIACDPTWHRHYGKIELDCDQWHWDEEIALANGYNWVEGIWMAGCSLEPDKISLNHSSAAQALNLAILYGCRLILLVGYDMTYRTGRPRHYFGGLSDKSGEYPEELRKWSLFDKGPGKGLLYDYKAIADQPGLPPIINCTPDSAMKWFESGDLESYLG